jgi:hypothetical protein
MVRDENDGETTCFGVATQPFAETYNTFGMHVLRAFNGELYSNGNTVPRGREQRTKVHPGTYQGLCPYQSSCA